MKDFMRYIYAVIIVLGVGHWTVKAIEASGEQKRMEIRLISAEIKSFMKPTGEEHE